MRQRRTRVRPFVRRLGHLALACAVLASGLIAVESLTTTGPRAEAAPTLTTGFSRTFYDTNMPNWHLAGLAFLPGQDRMLLAGKCGSLRRLDVDGSLFTMPSIPNVVCEADRGFLGIAPAPDFATSGRVYTLYNYRGVRLPGDPGAGTPAVMARLSRWTTNPANPTALNNEVVLINDLPAYSTTGATCDDSHTVGTVIAAPNGDVFVGNGDASSYCQADDSALSAQDLNSPRGKVLRINGTTGAGLAGNPYYDSAAPSSWRSRTFAYGLRNPFRISLKPGTSTLYVGDVGWYDYEEINVAKGGENFGWPCYEGPRTFRNGYAPKAACVSQHSSPPSNLKDPLWHWHHNGAGAAAVAGSFYPTGSSGNYPAAYRGSFFFGDYAAGKIWSLQTNSNDALVRPPEPAGFGSEIGGPVGFATGPDGDIYYADIYTSQVVRLRYAAGNRAPVAVATADKTNGRAPLTVKFDGDDSYDLDNEPLTYAWDFGDGTTSTAANPTKTYQVQGAFTAKLTVTDGLGASSSATVPISTENAPPVLLVTLPPAGTKYGVGDEIDIPVVAVDAEDGGILPASSVSYEQRIRHCPFGDCHEHPSETTTGVENQPFTCEIPDHGDDAYLQIIISVTDSDGATATRTVELETDAHDVSVRSSPAGVPITVNTTNSNTHPVVKAIRGSQNRVTAPSSHGGKVFVSWSDGGAADHTFVMGGQPLALVATYSTPPVARASASPTSGAAPLQTTLSAAGSSDADGDPLTYRWSFGDGTTGTGATVSHRYADPGSYIATVTVTDVHGIARSASTTVSVESATTTSCLGVPATVVGDDRANVLQGTSGRDVIWAGPGDDRVIGLAGDDLLCGGPGTDTVDFSGATAGVSVNLDESTVGAGGVVGAASTGGAGADRLESIEHVVGSPYDDRLVGSSAANLIQGKGGDDVIRGGGSTNDRLDGGPGTDTVNYARSSGPVTVWLPSLRARVAGASTSDVVRDFENVVGSAYGDAIEGTDAANTLDGGSGNDTFFGRRGDDRLIGGVGVDTVDYANSTSYIATFLNVAGPYTTGGEGRDSLSSIENVRGTAYNDWIVGSSQVNTIRGQGGNDRIQGIGAGDLLDGGAGVDLVSYADATAPMRIRIPISSARRSTASVSDVVVGFENIVGSRHADFLEGGEGATWMDGGPGNDSLAGRGGADVLHGGSGTDRADGGTGTDVCRTAETRRSCER